ncbi:DUF7674 family protein [Metabacillus iocasae]|uniref:DUF7674 domain-containing protein n=1 Tax=Priestia iocasae TaxID=2291674 RepID=A0ABS2QYB4_9BACI|nr:hypothetical protein [Metabacillus iocasae]MBM7703932.1 hypothetical protein [Metabacillus iocasae]
MITKEDVIVLLKESCSSYSPNEMEIKNKEELVQELSRFASHLISLQYNQQLEKERDVFELIERLYVEGEAHVKEAVTVGLFETMNRIIDEQHIDSEEIGRLLKPNSYKWWKTISEYAEQK